MRSKFFHAIAVAGIFALAGCSDEAKPTPVSLGENLDNPEASSDSEGGELPPGGDTGTLSSDASTLPGTSSPSGNNTLPGNGSSASGDNGNPLGTSSSENGQSVFSSSQGQGAQEQTFAFGYALKNEPRPSKGCGKNSTLQSDRNVENGQHFTMNVYGQNREYFVTLPQNYNKDKPYKLLFAMHCLGSTAEDFVHHTPDYDHPTPYYGQQKLDTEGNYIFVAPQGLGENGMPWSMFDDKDHKFFDQLLTTLEDNLCIDTSRVFVTGFSFGAMYSTSLAWSFQHRIRAIAAYAPVDEVIWMPQKNAGKPLAWMSVHGQNDGTCRYQRNLTSLLPTILKNNGKADANGNFTDASAEKPVENQGNTGHTCYDFKTVDERFPVKFCSWPGPHQWTAHDNGDMSVGAGWQETWVPEEAHKFFEQF